MPEAELVPHKNHRLLDAHTLLRAQPLVFGHERPGVDVVAAKHLEGFFVRGGCAHVLDSPGLGVVPMHPSSFPRDWLHTLSQEGTQRPRWWWWRMSGG